MSNIKPNNFSHNTPDLTTELYSQTGGVNSKFTANELLDLKYVEITYQGLKDLKDNMNLNKGTWYLMTDYQTIYAQPDYQSNGNIKTTLTIKTEAVERLLLFATSNDTLMKQVFSLDYPQDIVHYDINVDTTYDYNGYVTNTEPCKGKIIQRIDDKNNRTDYDHRTVKFLRYLDGSVYSSYKDISTDSNEYLTFHSDCRNNYIGDTYLYGVYFGLEFSNNVFQTNSFGNYLYNVCNHNTFLSFSFNNKFGYRCLNNIFNGSCSYNEFGCDTYNCVITNSNKNSIGDNCSQVLITDSDSNIITDNCGLITLTSGSNNNKITGSCYNVNLPYNNVGNIIESGCNNIIFGNSSRFNTIEGNCSYITFGYGCNYNVILKASSNIVFGNDYEYNKIFSQSFIVDNATNETIKNLKVEGLISSLILDATNVSYNSFLFDTYFDKSIIRSFNNDIYLTYFSHPNYNHILI